MEGRRRGRPRKAEGKTPSAILLEATAEEAKAVGINSDYVTVLSTRDGDIVLVEGRLKKNETITLKRSIAEELKRQFPEHIKFI
jgi:hypothetical protein